MQKFVELQLAVFRQICLFFFLVHLQFVSFPGKSTNKKLLKMLAAFDKAMFECGMWYLA